MAHSWPAIEAVGLTKKFGALTAVDAVTFDVEGGEVFGFLGPNGARKTTTIRMLCCLISKTSGGGAQSMACLIKRVEDLSLQKPV